jgi:hypothetical protein
VVDSNQYRLILIFKIFGIARLLILIIQVTTNLDLRLNNRDCSLKSPIIICLEDFMGKQFSVLTWRFSYSLT